MKANEAILLPTLHKEFLNKAYGNTASFPNITQMCDNDIPNSRWLLSLLHLYFENKIEVQCRLKRYGTLIHHKNCDLIHALTIALSKCEEHRQTNTSASSECGNEEQTVPSIKEQTQNVALYLNEKLHKRARMLTVSFNEKPKTIATTDVPLALANTDPDLLSFLSTLTQSVRQSKRKLFTDVSAH